MSKRFICLFSIVVLAGLVLTSTAKAADPGLVGWWKFEEESGTLYDQSDNHNDGTSFQGVLYQQTGHVGYALGFDGVDDYITVGTTGRPADTFSFGAWLKTSATHQIDPESAAGVGGVSGQRYAFDPQHGGDSDGGAGLSVGTNGILVFEHGSNYMPATAVHEADIGDDWNHIMIVYDNKQPTIYLNGQAVRTGFASPRAVVNAPIRFGGMAYGFFEGLMDEVRIYNRALSAAEIKKLAARPKASSPVPDNGALYEDTWVSLSWMPGGRAVSHDVFFGENFDDVNDGLGDTFRGNQGAAFYVAGFPGFAYPDGLIPGTTYYWRIDGINDAEPNSPWKGDVWSFSIPPKTAYNPEPADDARFIDPNVEFSWTPGFDSKLHTVYFGDNFDDVNNAAGGLPQALTTFTPPGPLEREKTYYWRVDEFDIQATHKGDVWSFATARAGGGIKGQYYRHNGSTPHDPASLAFGTLVLTRTDPEIAFQWGNSSPDASINDDDFAVKWTGEVEAAFTETYTFYTNTDDGVKLWVNDRLIVDNWTDHGTIEDKGTIDLAAGQTYSIEMWWYERDGGAVAELRWESPRTPKQIVPQAALSLPVRAGTPSPADGIVGVKLVSALAWQPGDSAGSHEVYFGTDIDGVANATKASPEYQGSKTLGDESFDPGKLAWDTTYFWRVDEVNNTNPDSPWTGNVWSFNTGDFLVVDDFESYNDIDPPDPASNRIFDKWIDGFGTTTNGALVGNDFPPYAEQTIVHGGAQSMVYRYDNANKTSEATLTLVYPRDWTEESVTKLSLWFRGESGNAAERMYVAAGGTPVVYYDDSAATQITTWNEWVIDLSAPGGFADQGADLANINTIAIGFGTKNSPAAGGTGRMYFDDIRLYR